MNPFPGRTGTLPFPIENKYLKPGLHFRDDFEAFGSTIKRTATASAADSTVSETQSLNYQKAIPNASPSNLSDRSYNMCASPSDNYSQLSSENSSSSKIRLNSHEREKLLDEREKKLDEREKFLDEREKMLEAKENSLHLSSEGNYKWENSNSSSNENKHWGYHDNIDNKWNDDGNNSISKKELGSRNEDSDSKDTDDKYENSECGKFKKTNAYWKDYTEDTADQDSKDTNAWSKSNTALSKKGSDTTKSSYSNWEFSKSDWKNDKSVSDWHCDNTENGKKDENENEWRKDENENEWKKDGTNSWYDNINTGGDKGENRNDWYNNKADDDKSWDNDYYSKKKW